MLISSASRFQSQWVTDTILCLDKNNPRKDLDHLVEIRVLNTVQKPKYGIPIFIITKTEGTMRFITDYHILNQKMEINEYPLNITGETMQQMEIYQNATE